VLPVSGGRLNLDCFVEFQASGPCVSDQHWGKTLTHSGLLHGLTGSKVGHEPLAAEIEAQLGYV